MLIFGQKFDCRVEFDHRCTRSFLHSFVRAQIYRVKMAGKTREVYLRWSTGALQSIPHDPSIVVPPKARRLRPLPPLSPTPAPSASSSSQPPLLVPLLPPVHDEATNNSNVHEPLSPIIASTDLQSRGLLSPARGFMMACQARCRIPKPISRRKHPKTFRLPSN